MSSAGEPPPSARSSDKARRLQAPYREGWVEVREELQRLTRLEPTSSDWALRWAVLRESFLYFFEKEEDIAYGGHVLKVDLRGAVCQIESKEERTLKVASTALFLVHGQRHSIVMRAPAVEDVQPWVDDLNQSAIWEMVLRAAASSLRRPPPRKKVEDAATRVDAASDSLSRPSSSPSRRGSSRPGEASAAAGAGGTGAEAPGARAAGGSRRRRRDTEAGGAAVQALGDAGDSRVAEWVASRTAARISAHGAVQVAPAEVSVTVAEADSNCRGSGRPRTSAPPAGAAGAGRTSGGEESSGTSEDSEEGECRSSSARVSSRDCLASSGSGGRRRARRRARREGQDSGSGEESGSAGRCPTPLISGSGSGGGGSSESSSDEETSRGSDEEGSDRRSEAAREEEARTQFFRAAFCRRASDSEESGAGGGAGGGARLGEIADLDARLESMDQAEARLGRVRRVRRLSRRRAQVWGAPHSWGDGFNYCLGHGSARDAPFPEAIKKLRTKGIVQVAIGGAHCAALSSSGRVYTWGVGLYGRLGHGDMEDRSQPTLMLASKEEEAMPVQVACGAMHSALVTKSGELWTWGMGLYGELGQGDAHDAWVPTRVLRGGLGGRLVSAVACGSHFTVALTAAGSTFAWGRGRFGCLGHGDALDRREPTPVAALARDAVVQVACGPHHVLALRDDGALLGWGRGKGGAHGRGHAQDAPVPGAVCELGARVVVDMACGRRHSVLLTLRGEVLTWGSGEGFALGAPSEAPRLAPARVRAVRRLVVVAVAAGGARTAALARGGDLYVWGGLLAGVRDPARLRDAALRFAATDLAVPEEGGVRDRGATRAPGAGVMRALAAQFPGDPGALLPGARPDAAPPAVLRAALGARVPPHAVLAVRFELCEGARAAALRYTLPRALAEAVPGANAAWADHCAPAMAGLRGGMGGGSWAVVRLQAALGAWEALHPLCREANADAADAARAVLAAALAAAPREAPAGAPEYEVVAGYGAGGEAGGECGDAGEGEGAGAWAGPALPAVRVLPEGADLGAVLAETQRALFGLRPQGAHGGGGAAPLPAQRAPPPRGLVRRGGGGVSAGRSGRGAGRGEAEREVAGADAASGTGEGEGSRAGWSGDDMWSVLSEESAEEGGEGEEGAGEHDGAGAEAGEDGVAERRRSARPRLLRLLRGEVVLVAMGDGVTIVASNKEEAGKGAMPTRGMHVSSRLRHRARAIERSLAAQEARDAAHSMEAEAARRARAQRGEKVAAEPAARGSVDEAGGTSELLYTRPAEVGAVDAGSPRDTAAASAPLLSHAAAAAAGGEAAPPPALRARLDSPLGAGATGGAVVAAGGGEGSVGSPYPKAGLRDATLEPLSEDGSDTRSVATRRSVRARARRLPPRQGWLVVHEVRRAMLLSVQLQGYLAQGAMQWRRMWAILQGNLLLLFDGPEEAEARFSLTMDAYYVADCTREAEWFAMEPGIPTRPKEPGERLLPTMELKPSSLLVGGPRRSPHLYCRAPDAAELRKWVRALERAAVLQAVNRTLVPEEERTWEADNAWAQPDAEAAWLPWADREGPGTAPAPAAPGGGGSRGWASLWGWLGAQGEGAGASDAGASDAGSSAAGAGKELPALEKGEMLRLREGDEASCESQNLTTAPSSASSARGAAGGRALPLPALFGAHMQGLSRELELSRESLRRVREHLAAVKATHAAEALEWQWERSELRAALQSRTEQLSLARLQGQGASAEHERRAHALQTEFEAERARAAGLAEAARDAGAELEEAREEVAALKRVRAELFNQGLPALARAPGAGGGAGGAG